MIKDYFILAIRNLRKRRLRSGLTMLGIIISIATIFVLISISIGLQSAVEEQFRQLGADKFFIIPKGQLGAPGTGGAVELTITDVEAIEKVGGIKSVSYITAANAKIEFGNFFSSPGTGSGRSLDRTLIGLTSTPSTFIGFSETKPSARSNFETSILLS